MKRISLAVLMASSIGFCLPPSFFDNEIQSNSHLYETQDESKQDSSQQLKEEGKKETQSNSNLHKALETTIEKPLKKSNTSSKQDLSQQLKEEEKKESNGVDHLHKALEAIIGKPLKKSNTPSKEEIMLKNIEESIKRREESIKRREERQYFDKDWWDNKFKKEYDEKMRKFEKEDKRNEIRGVTIYPKDPDRRRQYNQALARRSAYGCFIRFFGNPIAERYGFVDSMDDNPQKEEIKPYLEKIQKICSEVKKELEIFKEEIDDEKFEDEIKNLKKQKK